MYRIWPRLPAGPARTILHGLSSVTPPDSSEVELRHPKAYYAPVGNRTSEQFLRTARQQVLAIAERYGFPNQVDDASREEFDLEITGNSADLFPMGWAEAGSPEVWTHLAMVPLVDVTWWRWRSNQNLNVERFIATDFTRHTWSRLWWRRVQVDGDLNILRNLGERNLNQVLERRDAVGSSRELITAIADEFEKHRPAGKRVPSHLVRNSSKYILRQMVFIDDSALDADQRREWASGLVVDTGER